MRMLRDRQGVPLYANGSGDEVHSHESQDKKWDKGGREPMNARRGAHPGTETRYGNGLRERVGEVQTAVLSENRKTRDCE